MNASMNISDRPVTQQGLSGMKTAGLGPSRQIQDNSYYLQLLRAKCTEIMNEINTLKAQIEQSQKDNASYGSLERKYESLTTEMRTLQGKLADYNLMLDRTRVNKEAEDVRKECGALMNANGAERQRVDDVFNQRLNIEAQGREVEQLLQQHHAEMARRLDSVDPELKEKFGMLQEEHRRLQMQELPKKQADLHFFSERLAEMEQAVARDEGRNRLYQFKEDLHKLERQHQALAEELDGPQLSIPEQREMLLKKVKADNAEIAELERRLTETQDALRKGRAQLAQLQTDASAANDPKVQKHQELFQRDKEMSELIGTFDEKKAEELQKTSAAQAEIVRLLGSISRKTEFLDNAGNLSSQKLTEIKADLDFKQMQMDNSATTSSRLAQELDKRKTELDKIHTLDQKISTELSQLQEKMKTMKEELITFNDLKKLKTDAAERREAISVSLQKAREFAAKAKETSAELKKKYEEVKRKLSADETHVELEGLEQKMRALEQNVFLLAEYIDIKGAETMYQPVADECMNVLNQINAETISVLAEQPVFMAQMAAY